MVRSKLVKPSPEVPLPVEPEIDTLHAEEFSRELRRASDTLPPRINIDAESVEQYAFSARALPGLGKSSLSLFPASSIFSRPIAFPLWDVFGMPISATVDTLDGHRGRMFLPLLLFGSSWPILE